MRHSDRDAADVKQVWKGRAWVETEGNVSLPSVNTDSVTHATPPVVSAGRPAEQTTEQGLLFANRSHHWSEAVAPTAVSKPVALHHPLPPSDVICKQHLQTQSTYRNLLHDLPL